ncbi:hypothetical protein [Actinoplanes subglobosus]|uniref:Uncharacterized protein n=1 Tax=Actinoplanes subglobosus TaxID=1547892 RepID=A0ABV8J622_9ACTN
MNIRKSCAMAAGTLFLASAGIIGVSAPVAAAPAPATQTLQPSDPWPSEAYRKGYRQGFRDGWREAKNECENMAAAMLKLRVHGESEWDRGYDKGFRRGYAAGFDEFCY